MPRSRSFDKQESTEKIDENVNLGGHRKKCDMCHYYGHSEEVCPFEKRKLQQQLMQQSKTAGTSKSKSNEIIATTIKLNKNFASPEKCSFCGGTDHEETECLQKQEVEKIEYYSIHCHLCKEDGHVAITCPFNLDEVEKNCSSLLKKKNCTFCHGIDHSENECWQKTELEYVDKHGDLCRETGHLQDMRSFNFAEMNKKCSSTVTKARCSICNENDHSQQECIQKQVEYFGKYCQLCEKNGHLADTCPLNVEATENLSTFTYKKDKCNFCNDSDHSESECLQKQQVEYYSKYCDTCKEIHSEGICSRSYMSSSDKKQNNCTFNRKKEKKVQKERTKANNDLENFSTYKLCGEGDHSQAPCKLKPQSDDDSQKHCNYCNKHGHGENNCTLLQKDTEKQNRGRTSNLKTAKIYDSEDSDKDPEECDYCGNDHTMQDCPMKETYESFIARCMLCKDLNKVYEGHWDDNCPIIAKAIAKADKEDKVHKEIAASKKEKKKLKEKRKTPRNQKSSDSCKAMGTIEVDSVAKYCKDHDQFKNISLVDEEITKKMQRHSFSSVSENNHEMSKMERASKYMTFCNVHHLCETCHDVMTSDHKSGRMEGHSNIDTNNASSGSSTFIKDEPSDDIFRYCILCGVKCIIGKCLL